MLKTLSLLILTTLSVHLISAQSPCNPRGDFSFNRNPCAPLEVTYSTTATGFSNVRWFFGDAALATGNPTVSHTYTSTGSYQVVLITDYPTCSDTVRKNIILDISIDNQLIETTDTLVCHGSTKQIKTKAGLSLCWTPSAGLDNAYSQNPICTPSQTTTYYLNSLVTGSNLIVNGNFNAGNTGFTCQYNFTTNNTTEGEYFVGNSPSAWYPAHYSCGDHTTGNGNMLLVNGSPQPDVEVWKTTVSVTPNTNYAFSTWICSISVPNPAQLAFSINGNSVGNLIAASQPPCNWFQFYTTWNSGNNNSAVISIINKNTVAFGNDFALDDILFAPITFKRDSVTLTVEKPAIQTSAEQQICIGKSVQLSTSGGTSYSWSPATGLSNAAISNPVASPTITTEYIVTGTTNNNCTGKDTVLVTVEQLPVVAIIPDTSICENNSIQLYATGGGSYNWTPAANLTNANLANPIATPLTDTRYTVIVTSAQGCVNTDSVDITIRSTNKFYIDPVSEICEKTSVQLKAGGGNRYNWSPGGTLNSSVISSPVALPQTTTLYSVTITDTVCNSSKTLSTTVTVNRLPLLSVSKSNDIDCLTDNSQLLATGALQYIWTPAAGLSSSDISNPLATPVDTTTYTVTGTDVKGCSNTTSVTVNVSQTGNVLYLMPTAFTPNGDGKNDCYGIKYWGPIQELDFSIYNRWGERIFHTRNPGDCWNGLYKGIKQDPGVFVYVVKAKTLCGDAYRKGTFALIR